MRLLILYFKRKITVWTHEDQNPSFLALKMQKSAILAFCSQTAARPSLDLNVAAFDALFHNDPIVGVKSPSSMFIRGVRGSLWPIFVAFKH